MVFSTSVLESDRFSIPAAQENAVRSDSLYSESVYSERSLLPQMPPRAISGTDRSSILGPNRRGPYDAESSQENVTETDRNAPSSRSGSLISNIHGQQKRVSASSDENETSSSKSLSLRLSRSIFNFNRRTLSLQSASSTTQNEPESPLPSTSSAASSTANNTAGSIAIPSNVYHLHLPCESNNFAGFCKGAWKLQHAMKKAFRYTFTRLQVSTWRCSSCLFELPVSGPEGSVRPSAPSHDFDQNVRLHGATGIRYRLVWLAKSHVPLRLPPGRTGDLTVESTGKFACLFCCVEMRALAPVFSGVDRFMDHLRIHGNGAETGTGTAGRVPTQELLDWTKCILGRVAAEDEAFDINIPKVVVEIGGIYCTREFMRP